MSVEPKALSRRAMLGGAGAILGCAKAPPVRAATPDAPGKAAWAMFQQRFLRGDGRIVDTGNRGISHSEGQGVGLLSAAYFGDRETFQRILDWTRRSLSRPDDALHSWCYDPDTGNHTPDANNATDGDLLIGLALFVAADRWGAPQYRERGLMIARDVQHALLASTVAGTVLLPAISGFVTEHDVTVNPSYYVFPALRRFAQELPHPLWQKVWDDGLALLTRARFGQWALPPDWASLTRDGDVHMAAAWPPRSSFDAIRVPLHLCWAAMPDHPAVGSFLHYWEQGGGAATPAWSDLSTGHSAPYPLTPGMEAIRRLAMAQRKGWPQPALPCLAKATDYYAAALIMLVHVALAAQPDAIS